MSLRNRPILLVILVALFLLSGCGETSVLQHSVKTQSNADHKVSSILQVHFLDVGQADSILVITPNSEAILIDGGNNNDGSEIVRYLKTKGVKEISAMVATHPHEDHIGGLDIVLKNIPTKTVYMPNAISNTKTFEDFVAAVKASGAKRIEAKAGVTLNLPGIRAQFLAPNRNNYEELNDFSAVLKITYSKVSFLFTGDAETTSELEMLKSGSDVKANVLKIGHHGSSGSSSDSFLKAVSPQYAIISVGADNDYGHPAKVTLSKLEKSGVHVFRTDKSGTIIMTTEGETISIKETK